jgi:adenylyltransferase/sulfurtransferase
MTSTSLLNRYSRQMLVLGGMESQQILSNASVCVIGAGGIGSTSILYLTGAGVKKLTIVDDDIVEESNLHRQIIHDSTTIGISKAISAKQRIVALNPLIEVVCIVERVNCTNVLDIIQGHTVIIDATDNIQARYILSDACILLKIPLVSGSAIGFEGQITVLCTPHGPWYI